MESLRNAEESLEELGIPLKARRGSPALPVRLRQKISLSRAGEITSRTAPGPDPNQDVSADDYEAILSLIRMQCRTFEQAPAAFGELHEERLRDLIRASLNAVYESATAEAFRAAGKSDLCIEAGGRSAFVAECKIWSGLPG